MIHGMIIGSYLNDPKGRGCWFIWSMPGCDGGPPLEECQLSFPEFMIQSQAWCQIYGRGRGECRKGVGRVQGLGLKMQVELQLRMCLSLGKGDHDAQSVDVSLHHQHLEKKNDKRQSSREEGIKKAQDRIARDRSRAFQWRLS